jgi:hypothetical protein
MRNFKRFLRIAGFVLLFTFSEAFLSRALVPANLPSKMMMEDMAELTMRKKADWENIDVLVIGSSAAMVAVDPFQLEDELAATAAGSELCFNACSSLQQPIGSYYLLRDILRLHTPKMVIFSANFSAFGGETLDALQSNLLLFDFMQPSTVKLSFFLDAFTPADYPTVLLKSYHYRSSFTPELLNPMTLLQRARAPRDPRIHETATYMGKGFTAYTSMWDDTEPVPYYDPPVPDPEKADYLRKLLSDCRERGIRTILLGTPHIPKRLSVCPDYFSLGHAFFSGIAAETGAEYIDLNLAKSETLPIENKHFKDPSHVNADGAALVTAALAASLRGEGHFYESVEERLGSLSS